MPLLAAWFWLLLALIPLVFLERWIHRHLQGIWLLIFRDPDVATMVYALLMLPGVLVHEGSHWLVATLLGVRAGHFSIIPERTPEGTVRLGYVETERPDFVREALIGCAPLVSGSAVIILVGYAWLGAGAVGLAVSQGQWLNAWQSLEWMTRVPDFWLWVYLIFAVSNSMLPSASDRRAWLPLALLLTVLGLVLFGIGLGPALMDMLGPALEAATRALAAAFTLTVTLNLCLAPGLWLLEKALSRLTGLKVEY